MASWFNSVLDSRVSGPGSSPGRGHCVVFLGKTFYSQGGVEILPVASCDWKSSGRKAPG